MGNRLKTTDSKEVRVTRLVSALLTTNTIREAADEAGVPYSTAREWLYEYETQELLRRARAQMYDTALSRLQGLSESAVKVIEAALERNDVSVAKWLLDKGEAFQFAELRAQVDELMKARGTPNPK